MPLRINTAGGGSGGSTSPAYDAVAVTPDDEEDLPDGPCQALLLEAAGEVKVTTAGGTEITLPLVAGYNPVQVSRVWATPTPPGDVFALYQA